MKLNVLTSSLLIALSISTVEAAPTLIAAGTINSQFRDLSLRTEGALENGAPGNRLGGMGSALAYAGGETFLFLPDRGPNASVYSAGASRDNTTSYIPRFQTVTLHLSENSAYDETKVKDPVTGEFTSFPKLPFVITPSLQNTTLLSSPTQLNYGTAVDGAPKINKKGYYYFSGRSDLFDATMPSTNPNNGRLDPEGIRVSRDGSSVFITDEYGPYLYQFNRSTGRRMRAYNLPSYYAVAKPGPVGPTETSNNTQGRIDNKGMESLAISPDGKTLIGMMQQNLIQDTKKYLRIIMLDTKTGNVKKEVAYKLVKSSSVSDILAINDHEFLVLERDGNGLGDVTDPNATPSVVSSDTTKAIYKIDTDATPAAEVTGKPIIDNVASPQTTVQPTLFLDLVKEIKDKTGVSSADFPPKFEGAAFGQDITIKGTKYHTLFVATDNDFLPEIIDKNNVAPGKDNPNRIYVFTFTDADLGTSVFKPQTILLRNPNQDNG